MSKFDIIFSQPTTQLPESVKIRLQIRTFDQLKRQESALQLARLYRCRCVIQHHILIQKYELRRQKVLYYQNKRFISQRQKQIFKLMKSELALKIYQEARDLKWQKHNCDANFQHLQFKTNWEIKQLFLRNKMEHDAAVSLLKKRISVKERQEKAKQTLMKWQETVNQKKIESINEEMWEVGHEIPRG